MTWARSLTWISCAALIGCNHGALTETGNDGAGDNASVSSVNARPFSAELQCGLLPISVAGQGGSLQVTLQQSLGQGQEQDQSIDMQQRISASGARYVADTDAETSLWFKGENATLVLDGVSYPECAPPGAIVEPFRATGNEPFWALTLHHGILRFSQLGEAEQAPQPFTFERTTGQLSSEGQPVISGRITDQVCQDTMSGMPYPHQITLRVGNSTFHGCGGDPARLLQGAEWIVEDINGGGIIDRTRVTLNFWPDGRLTGQVSCNNLMAQYRLSGEGVTISQAAATRMACAPALMSQEQAVLENLQTVRHFNVDDTGALILHSSNGMLKARLMTPAGGL